MHGVPSSIVSDHDPIFTSEFWKSLLREVEIERDTTIRRAPTCILGSEIKKLRNREVKLVKVQWGDDESNATWETEEKMRSLYPFLFEGMSFNFSCIA